MEIKDFKVGDLIIILGKPYTWHSGLNSNSPFDGQVTYPFTCNIDQIESVNGIMAMSAGNFGWNLDTLIQNDLIVKYSSSETYEIY